MPQLKNIFTTNKPRLLARWAYDEEHATCPLFSDKYSSITSIEQRIQIGVDQDGGIYTLAAIDETNCSSFVNQQGVSTNGANYALTFGFTAYNPKANDELSLTLGNLDLTDGYIVWEGNQENTITSLVNRVNEGSASHGVYAQAQVSEFTLFLPRNQNLLAGNPTGAIGDFFRWRN